MKRGRLNLIISLIIGSAIFGFFLYKTGFNSIGSLLSNIQPVYLGIYLVITTLAFFPTAWRWKIILKAHNKKIPFLSVLRYTIAGYTISYITPFEKLGGEPLRAYMLKKEYKVDFKTGSSTIIVDKFVELLGTAFFGLMGLILFLSLPQLPFLYKIIFGLVILFLFYLLFIIYYRIVTGKGSFSSLFISFRLYKIVKLKHFVRVLESVEKRMKNFFLEHKKEFLLSCFTYAVYGVLIIFEFKFLLLSFGVDVSLKTTILALTLWGLAGFIPVPASLGVLEAGQTGLFSLVEGDARIGFVLSLLIRARALLFVAIGFVIISHFSGKQLEIYKKRK